MEEKTAHMNVEFQSLQQGVGHVRFDTLLITWRSCLYTSQLSKPTMPDIAHSSQYSKRFN